MRPKGSRGWWRINKAATNGGRFDRARQKALTERLRQGPGAAARQEGMLSAEAPTPSRWRLRTIRAEVPWLQSYTLSGVWRLLQRCGLSLRSARVQQFSPDPAYQSKQARLVEVLQQAAQRPAAVVVLFLDEMGLYRWPVAAPDWAAAPPLADRQGSKQQQWRLIGALNALTGQVDYLDGYIVGRAKVAQMYRLLDQRYATPEQIYVVQDNWNVHQHDEVLAVVESLARIEPIWLPTYAPWLNPIEKLWRWLREDFLKLHRRADQWPLLKQGVFDFLDQFASGSRELLRYVGLLGDGKLAAACRAA